MTLQKGDIGNAAWLEEQREVIHRTVNDLVYDNIKELTTGQFLYVDTAIESFIFNSTSEQFFDRVGDYLADIIDDIDNL